MSNRFSSESRDPSYIDSAICPYRAALKTHERLPRQALLAPPAGKRPTGQPRTTWSDFISDHAWTHLGVEAAELSETAVDREVFRVHLGLLPQ